MNLIAIARQLRRDLLRFELTQTELVLAWWLIELTFETMRESVIIPRLESLVELTDFSRGQVSRSLRALKRQRLLHTSPAERGVEYRLLPDAATWQVRPLRTRGEQEAALRRLLAEDGRQLELLEDPSLDEALADVSISIAASRCTHATLYPCNVVPVQRPPQTPPLEVQSLEALNVQHLKGGVGGATVAPVQQPAGDRQRIRELMARCIEVLGDEVMSAYGGGWNRRARNNPELLEKVLADIAEMQRRGAIHTNAGAAAYDLWKRWGGPARC